MTRSCTTHMIMTCYFTTSTVTFTKRGSRPVTITRQAIATSTTINDVVFFFLFLLAQFTYIAALYFTVISGNTFPDKCIMLYL